MSKYAINIKYVYEKQQTEYAPPLAIERLQLFS